MLLIIVKKKTILVALTVTAVAALGISAAGYVSGTTEETFLPVTNKVIYIDPGHGGRDPGAVGSTGKNEDEINLDIALRLKRLVEEGGGIAVLTRDGDYGLYSPDAPNKKREDLHERKKIADESESNINILIHLNSFTQSRYYGAQTFYYGPSDESRELAEIIQGELRNVLDKNNNRQPKPRTDLYLLKYATVPAVLVECGFLSNPAEEKLLNDGYYQEKIAWAIYIGILKYLSK